MSTAGPLAANRPERVAVVIPAKNEAERIEATIDAARTLVGVDLVVVVDDGSTDSTAAIAMGAGAVVVRHRVNRGKAAAMGTGAQLVALREAAATADGGADFTEEIHAEPRVAGHTGPLPVIVDHEADDAPVQRALLFLDADMGASASAAQPLVDAVLVTGVDMAIALLPPQVGASGMGIVVRTSRNGIRRATGWEPQQPLSGTRCITREAWEAVQPLAGGWGVETGLSIDAVTAGFWVKEIPCDLHHRATGKDLRGQLHRAAQLRDVVRALAARRRLSPEIPGEEETDGAALTDGSSLVDGGSFEASGADAPAPAAYDDPEEGAAPLDQDDPEEGVTPLVAPAPTTADATATTSDAPSAGPRPGPRAVEVTVGEESGEVHEADPADPAEIGVAADADSADSADADAAKEAGEAETAVEPEPEAAVEPETTSHSSLSTSGSSTASASRRAGTTGGTAWVRPAGLRQRLAALPVDGEFEEDDLTRLEDTDIEALDRALRDLPVEGLFDTDDIAYLAGVDLDALAARLHAAPVTGPFAPIHAVIIASHLGSPEPQIPEALRDSLAADEYTSLVVHEAVDAQNGASSAGEDPGHPSA
ncbi:glycosyltransferase [Brachybacterium sp. NBEC-018]|uniref:glycosyltransferase family 2 protein n=1 Tax=Brachybacterium sp. NBEC-018 TaxID=2996004 RepID=UPI0021754158|nr:glycosyltransferase [Brachybacterium sp. NBEC-018]UVY83909.1 glycosyltransferase [Brachybacterium sp. NBEC-018]